jgi:5-methylcytosine-specific restriction enzyme A
MPTAASRPCSTPGCGTYATPGESRCVECLRRAAQRKGSPDARGYDSTWRAFTPGYLALRPICADCGGPAIEVHHLDGKGPRGRRGFDPANLLPLCHRCHARRTAHDQPGGWHQPD